MIIILNLNGISIELWLVLRATEGPARKQPPCQQVQVWQQGQRSHERF